MWGGHPAEKWPQQDSSPDAVSRVLALSVQTVVSTGKWEGKCWGRTASGGRAGAGPGAAGTPVRFRSAVHGWLESVLTKLCTKSHGFSLRASY